MVAKCNEKIEEKLRAAIIHLELHRSTSLEGASRSDDQCKVVCSKFGVGVRCVGISISC